ncbi:hypothetical protein EZV62_028197 [Acer yangbiense]|uniref:Uncharacterized protein n=1 Tax=Acer yangbiense TaxID=1000413 RepID=A0A5C7GNE1_9ROSI|nr:hypothetical protein EZV62_028197 [Acer yangbiense]
MQAKDDTVAFINKEKPSKKMYDRLLNLASGALAKKEFKQEKSNFWEEPYRQASVWKPYADGRTPIPDLEICICSLGFYFGFPFANQTAVYRSATYLAKDDTVASINKEKPSTKMYDRLLNLASGTLAESSSKRNQISRMNHIGRHVYGNPVLIGELQI